jgi:hypothetical protein
MTIEEVINKFFPCLLDKAETVLRRGYQFFLIPNTFAMMNDEIKYFLGYTRDLWRSS